MAGFQRGMHSAQNGGNVSVFVGKLSNMDLQRYDSITGVQEKKNNRRGHHNTYFLSLFFRSQLAKERSEKSSGKTMSVSGRGIPRIIYQPLISNVTTTVKKVRQR